MGKAEELLKSMGGAILESASHRGAPAAMPAMGQGAAIVAERMAGVSRSKTALEIPVEKIERDETQPREEFDEDALARLSESIRSKGLLQPISVRWSEERGKYVVICGERRWRAARMAGMPTISSVVVDRTLTPGELLALQCIENLIREDLKPIEQARAFRTLSTVNNWSGNQLARELGISQSAVAQALALLDLPEMVQARVEAGELAPSTAYVIAKLDDAVEQAAVANRVVSGGMSRAEAIEEVRRVASARPGSTGGKGRGVKAKLPAKSPKSWTTRTTAGLKVTIEGRKGIEPATLLAAVEEVAAKLRAEVEAQAG
jgi:ParB family chromosome partitioning protein